MQSASTNFNTTDAIYAHVYIFLAILAKWVIYLACIVLKCTYLELSDSHASVESSIYLERIECASEPHHYCGVGDYCHAAVHFPYIIYSFTVFLTSNGLTNAKKYSLQTSFRNCYYMLLSACYADIAIPRATTLASDLSETVGRFCFV